jgi:hypothetical protein
MTNPKVVIIMARCSHYKQSFGIRLEEKSSKNWVADWAFPMQESTAKKEGYDNSQIAGNFSIDKAYPGCPNCERNSFCLCGQCHKVGCYEHNRDRNYTCAWCGNAGEVGGSINSLSVGEDG